MAIPYHTAGEEPTHAPRKTVDFSWLLLLFLVLLLFQSSTGKRKRRSDRFDESCPLLLACVGESIDENTQPSPCATRTLHDWTPGNHSRSQEDNSIVCLYEDKCKTANEKYVLGTRDDLYRVALSDVQVQVRMHFRISLGVSRLHYYVWSSL